MKIENIHKAFDGVQILKGINIDIKEGEVITIIGPSGSGKSTFLRTLNQLTIPEKGNVAFMDRKFYLSKLNKHEKLQLRQRFSMVFQHYNLFKNKTVLENVTEGLIIAQNIKKRNAVEIGIRELRKVGMEDYVDRYPSQLSGGQQQRVGIARAAALSPDYILFDEPTSALDPELVGEVLQAIQLMAQAKTGMIIVTHEMEFARKVSDRILFMDEGVIIEEGTPRYIFEKSTNPRLKQFLMKS